MDQQLLTCQNCTIRGKEAVLQSLLNIALLECLLLGHNLVNMLSCKLCNSVAAMSVVYPKERQSRVGAAWFAGLSIIIHQVQDRSMRILHTDSPSLHR